MTGSQLFRKRLFAECKFQYQVVRMVLDWTIIVYFVIPALAVGGIMYVKAWDNIQLYMNYQFPFAIVIAALLLLSLSGNIRTYVEEADVLFLMQRKRILRQLKLLGLYWSSFIAVLTVVVIFVIVLPILVKIYELKIFEIILLFLGVVASRLLFMTLRKKVVRLLHKWIVYPIAFLIAFFLFWKVHQILYGTLAIVGIFYFFTYHTSKTTNTNSRFHRELDIESQERIKYIQLILHFTIEVEKIKVKQHSKPILFRKSGRIFSLRTRENGFLELVLKAFLRNKGYVFTYLQITFITCSAIFIVPIWMKWGLFIGFYFFMNFWLYSIFQKLKDSPFFTIIPVENEVTVSVWHRFKKIFLTPSSIFVCVVTILMTAVSILLER